MLKFIKKINRTRLANRKRQKHNKALTQAEKQLKEALQSCEFPVLVVAYNNGPHISMMCEQLNEFNIKPIILNNNSTDASTLEILEEIKSKNRGFVVNIKSNMGHMVGFLDPLYSILPEHFAYTDPDIKFNEKLPKNFIEQLTSITQSYSVYKAGFALTTNHNGDNATAPKNNLVAQDLPFSFKKYFDVLAWEKNFWTKKLVSDNYELYAAPIDTTFAVYAKSNFRGNFLYDSIRVAGDYTAIHVPWFPKYDIMSDDEKRIYLIDNKSTTWIKD